MFSHLQKDSSENSSFLILNPLPAHFSTYSVSSAVSSVILKSYFC